MKGHQMAMLGRQTFFNPYALVHSNLNKLSYKNVPKVVMQYNNFCKICMSCKNTIENQNKCSKELDLHICIEVAPFVPASMAINHKMSLEFILRS